MNYRHSRRDLSYSETEKKRKPDAGWMEVVKKEFAEACYDNCTLSHCVRKKGYCKGSLSVMQNKPKLMAVIII